jgi:NarL family two-component system response regulator LiaR
MNNSEPIKVLIVDDHPIVRSGLATMLQAFDDLELVGDASSGSIALAKCQEVTPDVILMDMVMPEMDGLETTRAVLNHYPSVKIIVLSSFSKENMVQDALEAGATSYLLKDAPIDELANAIRLAYADQPTLSPEATRSLINSKVDPSKELDPGLSSREKQVLALIVEGMSNEEIAERLSISQATARHHVSACISKLGAANRTQAAVLAVKHNLT